MRAPGPVAAIAVLAAVALAAIPAELTSRPGHATPALASRPVVWSPDCRGPERGLLGRAGGARVPGIGAACDLAVGGGVLFAVDLDRGGRLVAAGAGGVRVLSPPELTVRSPLALSPDGRAVAVCADRVPAHRAEPHPVVYVARADGRLVRVGPGCDPAWTPGGVVYVSRFQRVFSEVFGAGLRVWQPGRGGRPLGLPAGSMITSVSAVPGADAVAVVSVQPSAEQTLLLVPVAGGGRAWRVRRVVGGQIAASAPRHGRRLAVAVWSRDNATTLYVADTAGRTLRQVGRVPAGRALWTSDGRLLVWAAATGPWRLYDPASGRLLITVPGRGTFAALS